MHVVMLQNAHFLCTRPLRLSSLKVLKIDRKSLHLCWLWLLVDLLLYFFFMYWFFLSKARRSVVDLLNPRLYASRLGSNLWVFRGENILAFLVDLSREQLGKLYDIVICVTPLQILYIFCTRIQICFNGDKLEVFTDFRISVIHWFMIN